MKLLDRFTGEPVRAVPNAIVPGRYALLAASVVNGHSELQAGDLLVDDGSGVIRIGAQDHPVAGAAGQSETAQTDGELLHQAILAIAGRLARDGHTKVSPMLPPELAAHCRLEDLERDLDAALMHLRAISSHPRQDLQYDDVVAPVARARRLATSALSHLASHSDCWEQRTLGGVQPRRVLARFSEDDYAIYENRLYRRLLDELDRHLAKRLRRVRELNLQYQRALKFQDSTQTLFRLRQEICTLWGECYQDDVTGEHLDEGHRVAEELERLLRAVRGLKQAGLYTLVSRAAVVPAQIHRTNILNHDPHYRHLPPLWETLSRERRDGQADPAERLARQQQLHHAYVDYVGLVLRRALERYDARDTGTGATFQRGGRQFTLSRDGHDWMLTDSGGDCLRLVPVAWPGEATAWHATPGTGRVVCWPGSAADDLPKGYLPVSPMDLYMVEKMGHLVDSWIIGQLLQGYGRQLGPLPTPVRQLTDALTGQFESLSRTHVRLVAPLDTRQADRLRVALREAASVEVGAEVVAAMEQLNVLGTLCGHKARFEHNGRLDFYCQCGTCDSTWGLRTSGRTRLFSMRPKQGQNVPDGQGFAWAGRDWIDLELGED
ncbi:hypothetical protein WQE_04557 [Paraburkholderia hospita]|uniref:DUF2357 domain-containing protein n=1 Tax=Paraburkholderia hospita TaxID=169430 RepID=A0ABP2Q1P9_9BURK|nr:DUF2357 domain-containing protein [Paraburkholderia hospita]EIN02317.1 hypothetical protein WQE_04557 [Paraburkholderia hospita]OUL86588.1 hypothetical protein CA602_15225 [Paraburkholderia hospita]